MALKLRFPGLRLKPVPKVSESMSNDVKIQEINKWLEDTQKELGRWSSELERSLEQLNALIP